MTMNTKNKEIIERICNALNGKMPDSDIAIVREEVRKVLQKAEEDDRKYAIYNWLGFELRQYGRGTFDEMSNQLAKAIRLYPDAGLYVKLVPDGEE